MPYTLIVYKPSNYREYDNCAGKYLRSYCGFLVANDQKICSPNRGRRYTRIGFPVRQ